MSAIADGELDNQVNQKPELTDEGIMTQKPGSNKHRHSSAIMDNPCLIMADTVLPIIKQNRVHFDVNDAASPTSNRASGEEDEYPSTHGANDTKDTYGYDTSDEEPAFDEEDRALQRGEDDMKDTTENESAADTGISSAGMQNASSGQANLTATMQLPGKSDTDHIKID
jgi:hypothetical protein